MSDGQKAVLEERLHKNYEDFLAQLQGKSVSELIAMAPEITAAKQCHEELLDACDEEDVAFLLQFDDPLEVVRGFWESEITGYVHSGEMGHMLWEIRDRELYSKEQLVPDFPEHMAHFTAMVIASDLGCPIAPYHLQRIVKLEQERHIIGIAGIQQFLIALFRGDDLWGHGNQFGDGFSLK